MAESTAYNNHKYFRASFSGDGEAFYRRLWEEQTAVNASKDKFLALLSHELRNPLAPLLTAVDLLQKQPLEKSIESKAVAIIQRQARQLAHLIFDLFEVSRFTNGKIVLRKEVIDARIVVERAIEASRPLIDEHEHDLLISLPDAPVWLHADPRRLEQVFINLLINAAKYTPHRGCIWAQLTHEKGSAVLRVRDSGRGITPELLPTIFDFLAQADSNAADPQSGLGIGLAIVRSFIELHGGKVSAHSEGLERGADFIVELPITGHTTEPAAQPKPATCAHPLRVLIVDDNADAANTLKMLLQLSGHKARAAYTGMQGIETAQHFRPDVVLLDIGLPDVDGYVIAQRLRSQLNREELIIIALTGFGGCEDREKAEKAGFNCHLTKPVDTKQLQEILARVGQNVCSLR